MKSEEPDKLKAELPEKPILSDKLEKEEEKLKPEKSEKAERKEKEQKLEVGEKGFKEFVTEGPGRKPPTAETIDPGTIFGKLDAESPFGLADPLEGFTRPAAPLTDPFTVPREARKEEEMPKFKPEKELAKVEKMEKIEHKEKNELKDFKVEKSEQKEIAKPEIKENAKGEFKEHKPEVEGKDLVEHGKGIFESLHPGLGPDPISPLQPQASSRSASAGDLEERLSRLERAVGGGPVGEKFQRDITKVKPEKELAKVEHKEHLKIEVKELKQEKYEIKELKQEHLEKMVQKELLPEKGLVEQGGKDLVENVDPSIFSNARPEAESHPAAKASGSIEERVARLETAVSQLYHFIPAELRPDLSTGALSRESDQSEVSDAASAEEPRAEERPGGAERAGAKTRKGKQG